MKRALVISGGGAKGAFEAGVIQVLAQAGREYDLVVGVSTGALAAIVLGQGTSIDAADRLVAYYRAIRGSGDIYRSRGFWGKLRGGLYNLGPIRQKIRAELDGTPGSRPYCIEWARQVLIGVVDLGSGKYKLVAPYSGRFADYVLASCSFPPFFPPVKIYGRWYMDGGLRNIAPLKAAIDAGCQAIDVILASPREMERWKESGWTWDIAARALEIVTNELYRNDLTIAKWVNRCINTQRVVQTGRRYIQIQVFEPDMTEYHRLYPGHDYVGTLDFDPEQIKRALAYGAMVAEKVLG